MADPPELHDWKPLVENLRARGEMNQVAGKVRDRVGEAGRKIGEAVDRAKRRR